MATSVGHVLRELCAAPLQAATEAEADYRRIWGRWLADQKALIAKLPDAQQNAVDYAALLQTAPVVSVNSQVDLAVSMRIASVKDTSASGDVGISVGAVQASGSFGFASRTTEESMLQAATSVVLSNNEQNLIDYLARFNLAPADAAGLDQAIALLKDE